MVGKLRPSLQAISLLIIPSAFVQSLGKIIATHRPISSFRLSKPTTSLSFSESRMRKYFSAFVSSPSCPQFVPSIFRFRGGCAKKEFPEVCPFCTKVHARSSTCRAATVAHERKRLDGWALLSTMRERQIGEPKGIEEYGWGPAVRPPSPAGAAAELLSRPDGFAVLGVETSCDDTAAAVVHSDGRILGESKRSQNDLLRQWGGVVPNLARDAHAEAIEGVVAEALAAAGLSPEQLGAVGVTMGPGLEICLRVGFHAARDLALRHQLPFVSVHHLEAHVLTARQFEPSLAFPFLVLLVSGGHCQILKARGVGDYVMLGGTLDDSLGEAYDKAARMLGLDPVGGGGGGGPALEALARGGDPNAVKFAVPMRSRRDCNLSFAGLKTAVRMAVLQAGGDLTGPLPDPKAAADIAASFQHVAIKHLEERLVRAVAQCRRDAALGPSDPAAPLKPLSTAEALLWASAPAAPAAAAAEEDGAARAAAVVEGAAATTTDGSAAMATGAAVVSSHTAAEATAEEAAAAVPGTLVVCGGVAANAEVRSRLTRLAEERLGGLRVVFPPARLCTDNGVMVAWAAVERLRLGAVDDPTAMEVRARWPLGINYAASQVSARHTRLPSTSGRPAAAAAAAASPAAADGASV